MTANVSAKGLVRPTWKTSPTQYRIVKWVITALMHIIYRYEYQGVENVPLRGPVILAVNHLHLFDPGAVAPAVPRKIVTFAADKYINNWLLGGILRCAGVIFVKRGEVDRDALRASLEVLKEGGALAVAPEGTRSRVGSMQRAKPGLAYLATRANAAIVPMGFWGIEQLRDWKHLRRPRCRLVIGKPFRFPSSTERVTTERLQELTDLTMIKIGLLIPPQYRGVYAERVAAVEEGRSHELDELIEVEPQQWGKG